MKNISKSAITEITLILFLLATMVLRLKDYNTDILIYSSLTLLNIFWIFRYKLFNERFNTFYFIETLLASILIWAIALNIMLVPFTNMLVILGFLVLSIFYFIKFIITIIKTKEQTDVLIYAIPLIVAIVCLGMFLRFMYYPGGGVIRVLVLSFFSMVLFIYGIYSIIRLVKADLGIYAAFVFISYLSLCIVNNGFLFKLMHWPGSYPMYIIGATISVIFGLVLTVMILINGFPENEMSTLLKNTLIRLFVFNVIVFLLMNMSKNQYLRLEFGNRPALINSYIKCRLDGQKDDNSEACIQFEELDNKMRAGNYPEGSE